ncbi:IdeS/Mac family cysteine endopeptidase [Clostridium chauvoei]|uniref:Ig protease IdeS domain-containing protein n=2 Tax=Clostridium chauvoei TaxID=46867 RepID=S6FJA4_9CLOT|nr:IdeS/Mac family cysteine endopeptidase [Clostridium chauvoei]ATD54162.1 hypothetical protein BTM20_02505 [Clostridium chauvoei]MBX7281349.1 IdeS/Mac family cysteine endopeptidase [Clostridium chauvoei]MBX7283831.1 IdeS/Mac family cysteine endopeptidase [Clostridium chauvoei]MBX7286438.1 IdeS/Mac family cysteine endopeptidase [Clostridium chauvoei]MBX7288875.1 IdeS/Mac family cysteine endopeptidase [Clostridium chauvoei]
MLKKTKIISAILLASILSLNFSKTLTTYADSPALNYDSKYDLNNDSVINELDINEISKYYNIKNSSPNWNEKFDFNNDGIIDIFDIIKISKRNDIKKPKKKSSKNALKLKKLISNNKNITTTVDSDGKQIYNVWVKGITPPAESDFTNLNLGANYSINVDSWKPGQDSYDINKLKMESSRNNLAPNDKTLLLYINGSGMGLPTSPSLDTRTGFFNGVPKKEDNLINKSYVRIYHLLNIRLLDWLQEDKSLGVSNNNIGIYSNNVITLLGASFDKSGNLLGIYVIDSNGKKFKISKDILYGIKYYKTVKDSN